MFHNESNEYVVLFSDALQAGASQFEASAGRLKRKFWWKNCKVCHRTLTANFEYVLKVLSDEAAVTFLGVFKCF